MPRTKDFLLIVVTIVFLLLGISSTLIGQNQTGTDVDRSTRDIFVENEIDNLNAEVITPEEIDRESRLAKMRQKIADSNELIMAPTVIEDQPTETPDLNNNNSDNFIVEPELCSNFTQFAGSWPVSDLEYREAEGVRVYYQEAMRPEFTATSGDQVSVDEVIRLQLPLNPTPSVTPNCIGSDVVGIATDNSLIRINEASLYSVFDESTMVGIALDGYPIYGVTANQLDRCGGSSHSGSYAYYLSAERENILNCFTAQPTTLQ
jgi:hypothetical protein